MNWALGFVWTCLIKAQSQELFSSFLSQGNLWCALLDLFCLSSKTGLFLEYHAAGWRSLVPHTEDCRTLSSLRLTALLRRNLSSWSLLDSKFSFSQRTSSRTLYYFCQVEGHGNFSTKDLSISISSDFYSVHWSMKIWDLIGQYSWTAKPSLFQCQSCSKYKRTDCALASQGTAHSST